MLLVRYCRQHQYYAVLSSTPTTLHGYRTGRSVRRPAGAEASERRIWRKMNGGGAWSVVASNPRGRAVRCAVAHTATWSLTLPRGSKTWRVGERFGGKVATMWRKIWREPPLPRGCGSASSPITMNIADVIGVIIQRWHTDERRLHHAPSNRRVSLPHYFSTWF